MPVIAEICPRCHVLRSPQENSTMTVDPIKEVASFGSASLNSASRGGGSHCNSITSPTHRRIEQIHASLGVPPEAAIRPTEAQLRWAQFQSQKRAKDTQQKIKKLYRFPASVSDIKGYIPGQDDISSSSSSSSHKEDDDQSSSLGGIHPPVESILIKRKDGLTEIPSNNQQCDQPNGVLGVQHRDIIFIRKRPRISKGRKALLRVSSREYQLRKQQIKKIIEIQPSSTTDASEEMPVAPQHDEVMPSTPNPLQTTPNRPRRSRMSGRVRSKVFSHIQHGAEEEEERVRRFEEAFQAITIGLSFSALSGDSQTIATSLSTTKRWKRLSSETSTVDFNSVSRFGSIAHPHTLVGVPTIVLQRRKQRHVQGIDLEHTDSWIRYIRSQQNSSEMTERASEKCRKKDLKSEIKNYPGEQEFAKLRTRLQNTGRTKEGRVIPEAYKNTFTHRKQQNDVEMPSKEETENEPSVGNAVQIKNNEESTPAISFRNSPKKIESKPWPMKSTNSEKELECHQKNKSKELSIEGQALFDAPLDRSDQDFSPEYLKRWKQAHDKKLKAEQASHSLTFERIKPGAFFGKNVEESSTSPEGAVKNKVRLHSKVEKCQRQPDVCSTVSKTERQNTDSAASGNHYLFPAENEQPELLLTPDMIKKWLELNGNIIDEIESVTMTPTDVGEEEYHQRILVQPSNVPSLVLTPSLLTKRLRQCIFIIKSHEWEKASYLINANPWLVEMTDVLSGQMLLHVLALYGETAPERLNSELINAFPSSVHKFDEAGNLALHLAAESGNVPMIRLLGDRFPGGASVQNISGLLPLHLSVLSGIPEAVSEVASLFPGATGIQDNEGNLPLHLISTLRGDAVLPIVRILLQYDTPVRIQSHVLRTFSNEAEFASFDESDFDFPTSPKYVETGIVLNNDCLNPLVMAIRSMLGWEVVEALLKGSGGEQAALECNSSGDNALHLAASAKFADPSVVLTLLKFVPAIATVPSGEGILPIELVCMQRMPEEVILALVLVDLRFDLQSSTPAVQADYGKNWWFLVCDCDDEYHDVVKKVLLKCSYYEAIALCFMEGGASSNRWSVISRATPKCKSELQKVLRFAGRYEFVGGPQLSDSFKGLTVYDAFDFGSYNNPREEKQKVTLKCYSREQPYKDEIHILKEKSLDYFFVEKVTFFELDELQSSPGPHEPQQYCIAIEKPKLTLGILVEKVSKISNWRKDASRFCRYMNKVGGVLRKVAKALHHLHSQDVVHGCVSLDTVGKFDDVWKLMSVSHLRQKGSLLPRAFLNRHSPPEAVRLRQDDDDQFNALRKTKAVLHNSVIAQPSLDVWSFGKLCYEALSGDPLFPPYHLKDLNEDYQTLELLGGWKEENLKQVADDLLGIGVTTLGVDLIIKCLQPKRADRPQSMDQILRHDFWKELKTTSVQGKKF